MRKLLRKIRASLFLKLLLVLLGTWLAVNLLVGSFYGLVLKRENHPGYERHLQAYSSYLIDQLGSPPDTLAARVLCDSLNMRLAWSGPAGSWASSSTLHPITYYQHQLDRRGGKPWFFMRGGFYLLKPVGDYTFLLAGNTWRLAELREEMLILLILLLSGVLVAAWYAIRYLLRPMRWLNRGVEQVAGGDLSHRIPLQQADELGLLSESFNAMTRQIAGMIQARDQLLRDVSHELRSPLTRMKVALEMMPAETRRESIAEDISGMESMIAGLLEAGRLDSRYGGLQLEDSDLCRLIREVAARFDGQAPGIELHRLPEACLLNIDPQRIATVFRNLFENGLKYSPDTAAPLRVTLEERGDSTLVALRDFGNGITEDDLPHIFEPFYRVDKSRSQETGGYGLGMSICRKIMEAHGGSITIESELGVGTVVNLMFKEVR